MKTSVRLFYWLFSLLERIETNNLKSWEHEDYDHLGVIDCTYQATRDTRWTHYYTCEGGSIYMINLWLFWLCYSDECVKGFELRNRIQGFTLFRHRIVVKGVRTNWEWLYRYDGFVGICGGYTKRWFALTPCVLLFLGFRFTKSAREIPYWDKVARYKQNHPPYKYSPVKFN